MSGRDAKSISVAQDSLNPCVKHRLHNFIVGLLGLFSIRLSGIRQLPAAEP